MPTIPYAPIPLTKKEVQAEFDYFNDVVRDPDSNLPIIDPNSGKPVVAGMRALWETGASYVDSYHLTSELTAFLHPGSAAETWATRGAKLAYISNLQNIGQLLGLGQGIAGTIGAAGVGGGLLLAEKLKNQLREIEWQYETWKNAPEQVLNYPILMGQQYLRQAGMGLLGTITSPFSYGLGLSTITEVPDFRFQFSNTKVKEIKRVNRITNGWRSFWADSVFQNLADKHLQAGHLNRAYGFNKAARKLKEGSHKTNPISLIFSSLIGTALSETLIMWLEKSVFGSKIAATLTGAVFPALKAIVSFPTAATAYMGYKLFPNTPSLNIPFTPFSLPLGGLIGAAPGLYYQTLLNWVHNTEPIRRNIFLASPELRRELMPRWMDVNNPAHINEYFERFTRTVPGSSYLQEPSPLTKPLEFREFKGTDELLAIKAEHFPTQGMLGKIIGKPVEFLFKNPVGRLVRLPFRGYIINSLLGLPMGFGPGTATGNLILAGDYVLQIADEIPTLKNISKGTIWGAAIGAEAAYIAGLPMQTGLIAGGSIGLLSSVLTSIADMRTPFRALQTAGPYASAFDVRVEGGSYSLWKTTNPIRVLRQQFPFLNKPIFSASMDTLERFPKFFQGLYNLRYFKGASIGAMLGVQLSLLTDLPLVATIPLGAGIGVGSQFVYEKYLAERIAQTSFKFGEFLHTVGRGLNVVGGFLSGTDIVSATMDILKNGITNLSAIQLGAGLIGATATVLYFGISNPIGWLIVSVGALAELVSRYFFHTSFFGWMWSKIAPVFSGIANSFGQIAGNLLGALVGLVGAVFSRSPEEMLQNAIMTAVSVSAIGTLLLQIITASGFFSGVSVEARRRATGSLYFKTDKKIDSLIKNSSNQITGVKYNLTYTYIKPFVDSENNPINEPLENIKIIDVYLAPETLTTTDIVPPPEMNYQREITLDNLPSVNPGETQTTSLTINFSQPLDQLLAQHQTNALCNQATLYGTLKGSPPNPIVSSNTICLNQNGQVTSLPTTLIANNLAEFLNQCYVQTCGGQKDYVTKEDFIAPADQKCPDLKEILACKLQYQSIYNINDNAINEIKISATDQRGWLDSLGFVKAIAVQQGKPFDYQSSCAENYEPAPFSQAKPGNILILNGQEFGIITSISSISNQQQFRYISVNSTNMQGYPYTDGGVFSSDVNQVLNYNSNYHCP